MFKYFYNTIINNQKHIIDIYKPSITNKRTMKTIINFHLEPEDKIVVEKAAALERLSVSAYVRNKVLGGIKNE